MGCIITYGSYVNKKENLINISLTTAIADSTFAILAGLAIIPAVFAFGISPERGPGLFSSPCLRFLHKCHSVR